MPTGPGTPYVYVGNNPTVYTDPSGLTRGSFSYDAYSSGPVPDVLAQIACPAGNCGGTQTFPFDPSSAGGSAITPGGVLASVAAGVGGAVLVKAIAARRPPSPRKMILSTTFVPRRRNDRSFVRE
jgi:hypothetical protein